jgi:hypothetical protein
VSSIRQPGTGTPWQTSTCPVTATRATEALAQTCRAGKHGSKEACRSLPSPSASFSRSTASTGTTLARSIGSSTSSSSSSPSSHRAAVLHARCSLRVHETGTLCRPLTRLSRFPDRRPRPSARHPELVRIRRISGAVNKARAGRRPTPSRSCPTLQRPRDGGQSRRTASQSTGLALTPRNHFRLA